MFLSMPHDQMLPNESGDVLLLFPCVEPRVNLCLVVWGEGTLFFFFFSFFLHINTVITMLLSKFFPLIVLMLNYYLHILPTRQHCLCVCVCFSFFKLLRRVLGFGCFTHMFQLPSTIRGTNQSSSVWGGLNAWVTMTLENEQR